MSQQYSNKLFQNWACVQKHLADMVDILFTQDIRWQVAGQLDALICYHLSRVRDFLVGCNNKVG